MPLHVQQLDLLSGQLPSQEACILLPVHSILHGNCSASILLSLQQVPKLHEVCNKSQQQQTPSANHPEAGLRMKKGAIFLLPDLATL